MRTLRTQVQQPMGTATSHLNSFKLFCDDFRLMKSEAVRKVLRT
jgi:hypothetical protein